MAAATMSGADGHRMEQKKFEYFSSMNSMARKIMLEREKIKERYGSAWDTMTQNEQDAAIDNGMMDPHIRTRYAMHKVDREEVICYPRLLIQTGQKIVHFGEEDLTWQDEHSAPFSWETKSQLDFNMTSALPEQPVSTSSSSIQADPKPAKVAQSSQLAKGTPSGKPSNGEGPSLGSRQEEESSFWKISAERSRLDGEKANFLTPSQIKSLEKGEKPLPSYLRPETPSSSYLRSETPSPSPTSKEPEDPPPPSRSSKQRAPRPPAPPPPIPVAIAVTPAAISAAPSPAPVSVSSTVAGWERAQSTLPSVSSAPEEVFLPGAKTPARSGSAARDGDRVESPPLASSPTFAQFNTSNNILKTGFDFLDNW
ncbi:uncharacterized protein C1orf198 homolog [Osmerus eperlanus]|uniref:uncharacterized protein C1orf198 homolog n=1 Tax=Osmerus eperlanus TaxID=29151 RepID=UPI002E1476CD